MLGKGDKKIVGRKLAGSNCLKNCERKLLANFIRKILKKFFDKNCQREIFGKYCPKNCQKKIYRKNCQRKMHRKYCQEKNLIENIFREKWAEKIVRKFLTKNVSKLTAKDVELMQRSPRSPLKFFFTKIDQIMPCSW